MQVKDKEPKHTNKTLQSGVNEAKTKVFRFYHQVV